MADPMWTDGHPQFQDAYPWIWVLMSDWMKAPFYPTDPPRTPGAMADSVVPMADLPVIGGFYGYFIIKYCEEYATAWYADPPGTSSTTPVALDVPVNWTPGGDQPYSNYYLKQQHDTYFGELTTSLGYDAETPVHDKLDSIAAAVGAIPDPPTGFATTADVARILAAIAYVARQVCYQNTPLGELATSAELADAVSSIKGADDRSVTNAVDAITDPSTGAIRQVNDNTNAIETSINGNVDSAESAILNAIAALPTPTDTPFGYPGSGSVTFGSPVGWSEPAEIPGPMDGCCVEITTQAGGTGHHDVSDYTSWQHAGWLAFVDDQGNADELQWLNFNLANYCPKRLAAASSVLIFPRGGSSGTLTPWTRNA